MSKTQPKRSKYNVFIGAKGKIVRTGELNIGIDAPARLAVHVRSALRTELATF